MRKIILKGFTTVVGSEVLAIIIINNTMTSAGLGPSTYYTNDDGKTNLQHLSGSLFQMRWLNNVLHALFGLGFTDGGCGSGTGGTPTRCHTSDNG